MIFKNKNKFRPIYKPLVYLKENIQNREKLLQFKKKKWQKIISTYKKKLNLYKKIKAKDQTQYLVSRYPNVNFAYKKQHRNTLKEIKKFKLIYGGLLNKIIKKLLNKNKCRILNRIIFLKKFESRLDVTLFRCKLGSNIRYIRQLISHGKVFVNKTKVITKSYILKPGDTVEIKLKCYKFLENSILRSLWPPVCQKHLIINYKTMQFCFLSLENDSFSLNLFYYIDLEKVLLTKFIRK